MRQQQVGEARERIHREYRQQRIVQRCFILQAASLHEVCSLFRSGWGDAVVYVEEVMLGVEEFFDTRFDMEHDPSFSSRPPLAWCALFRRRLELDASSWKSVEDAWDELNAALRPRGLPVASFERLLDLLLRDASEIQRPLTIAVMKVRRSIPQWARRLQDVTEQTKRDNLFNEVRHITAILYD
eukprot:755748-Hanusia_phi.AAC.7